MNIDFEPRPVLSRYIRYALLFVVLGLSIKPLLFTWNLLMAGFYHNADMEKAAEHMHNGFRLKPGSYPLFAKTNRAELDNWVVKETIRIGQADYLNHSGLNETDINRIKLAFKDNFYLQRLLHTAPLSPSQNHPSTNWQNLDSVTLELIADPSMNSRTVEILQTISPSLDPEFIANLIDYCKWKKNLSLQKILETQFRTVPSELFPSRSLEFKQSFAYLDEVLKKEYRVPTHERGENLVHGFEFSSEDQLRQYWILSKMAGAPSFGDASYTFGVDVPANRKNGYLRIMGFFVNPVAGKSRPRGGAWFKKNIELQQGYYIFSFDYATKTGKEEPAFWLCRDIGEVRLPHTNGKWVKVVYILDNSENNRPFARPLFRSWGTGTYLVDNLYMVLISKPRFAPPSINPWLWIDGKPLDSDHHD